MLYQDQYVNFDIDNEIYNILTLLLRAIFLPPCRLVCKICEPASHAIHRASHASHVSHASHSTNVRNFYLFYLHSHENILDEFFTRAVRRREL